ncbi:MAG: hypothetical protein GY759_21500 [Chloroflexi bacterium]|nr:hypothetical protein [Chloroflexota bacterium]
MLSKVNHPEFTALKGDIESHPRLCGYYIVDLVSIEDSRAIGMQQEGILELLVEHFDDDPNEPDPEFVPDHEWSDYETTLDLARSHTIRALVGGKEIGHTAQTMQHPMARDLFDRFTAVCGSGPRFYVGLGIGRQEFVFQYGVMIVADDMAGIFWIVESD